MILGSPGGPLGRSWEGFWKENSEMKKKVEKKTATAIASEGHAMAGREGFGKGKWVGQARSNTPGPMGWAGGLFALRVTRRGTWRLEAWRLEAWRV